MAWVSKKQYAILKESEEGKDLIEQLPNLSQNDFQIEFGKLLGKTGQTYEEDEKKDVKKKDQEYVVSYVGNKGEKIAKNFKTYGEAKKYADNLRKVRDGVYLNVKI